MKTIQTQTIQQVQAEIVRNQARIIDLLKWDVDTYSAFMYNSGLEFLTEYCHVDPTAIDELAPRREFWNWWKNQWNERDTIYIMTMDGLEDSTSLEEFRKVYRMQHDPKILVCEIHPPRIIFGNKFTNVTMKAV